jgi:hypothetical protein
MTGPNILIEKWSRAHASFNEVEGVLDKGRSLPGGIYRTFFDQALRESPNGRLYRDSSFLNDLGRGEKVRLGHVTYRLDEIRQSGTVYASGGCLVGSTYCFPFARATGSESRFHNLGEYIYREETAGRSTTTPDVLMFEVDLTAQPHSNLLGLDYLKLGEIHYDLFADLSYLLSPREMFDLKHGVERRVISALPFLKLCNEAWLGESRLEPGVFFRTLCETVPRLPVLGYLYFEAVSEYLMLYANCPEAARCLERGEFYNVPYKRLAYGLYPEYKNNFRLTDFNPTLETLTAYLQGSGFIRNFATDHFTEHIVRKMVNLVNRLLISDEGAKCVAANQTWNLERMASVMKPLLGHMIHRELRSFERYHDFYFYYDQMKALQAWNYWNHMGIAVPFNGVFPKGEVGLNPANPELAVRSFRCQVRSGEDGLYAEPVEELNLRFVPRLVDLKYTLMRNKN